jgi:hypothetical protein
VPRIRVYSRIPPLPWEPGYWGVGGVRVRLEGDVSPEDGPLAFLRSIWPERYVVWSVVHQLWEVRQLNPVTGEDERVELLRRLVDAPGGGQVPAYLPFDYEWLRRRAKNRHEFLTLGPEKYDDLVQERNRARSSLVLKDTVREMAAGLRELQRYPGAGKWSPVLVDLRRSAGGIIIPSPSNGKG